ncbi:protein of unknown function (plasmid) [Cupriavidus taiwanensis]|nr:protein of unknown function [Cupriavidus taiwanensis]SPA03351.1 protein of unknown function [Cupriavidus taiwanensis]SPA11718.1 protein of unknown function [Cupriavidus taiwanensis]SPA57617.1 protein of unknown function [Cupriavidus taiwanensis]
MCPACRSHCVYLPCTLRWGASILLVGNLDVKYSLPEYNSLERMEGNDTRPAVRLSFRHARRRQPKKAERPYPRQAQ